MSPRRSSAEIINATLIEVFLAFLFVVLALAWFHGRDLASAKAALDNTKQQNSQLTEQRDTAIAQRNAANEAHDRIAARFLSQFPPLCQGRDSGSPYFLIITLTDAERVMTEVKYDHLSHRRGQVQTLSLREFGATFTDVVTSSREKGCRFRVLINDTDRVSKADFKRAIGFIKERFYIWGETR